MSIHRQIVCVTVISVLVCISLIAGAAPPASAPASDAISWVSLGADGSQEMSDSVDDLAAARALQHPGEPLFYFRQAGKAWIIRDAATLARIHTAWTPVHELGKRMGALGGDMGALGAKQGIIGAQLGAIGGKLGALGGRLANLRLGDKERAKIEAAMNALEESMEPLQHDMDALDAQMAPLEAKMDVMDSEMDQAVEAAERAVRAIVDDARAHGLVLDAK